MKARARSSTFTAHFDVVTRYQGGHNAGHTVIISGKKYLFLHLIPSGILHPDKVCVSGTAWSLISWPWKREIAELRAAGIDCKGRLLVSQPRPCHPGISPCLVETAAEERRGENRIGTTQRGIGPAYEDKNGAPRELRLRDLPASRSLNEEIGASSPAKTRSRRGLDVGAGRGGSGRGTSRSTSSTRLSI